MAFLAKLSLVLLGAIDFVKSATEGITIPVRKQPGLCNVKGSLFNL